MKTCIFWVKLFGDERVIREIEVIETITLYKFAEAIVKAYNFRFDHSFGFYSGLDNYSKSEIMYELFVDIEGQECKPGAKSVKKTKVMQVWLKPDDKMLFLFDYGDEWMFEVTLKATGDKVEGVKYPRIISKIGQAPTQYG